MYQDSKRPEAVRGFLRVILFMRNLIFNKQDEMLKCG